MQHIIETFLRVVKEHGSDPAVSDENSTFTYAELLDFSRCVAANLKAKGVGKGDRVIVEIRRSKEYAGCLLACWMIGAVSIPLSDDYPEERLAYIKKDSQYRISIDDDFMASMDGSVFADPIVTEMDADGVVIYTSGSTGNPKGVVHNYYSMAAVVARNAAHEKADDTKRNDVFGMVAPFTFIVGVSHFLVSIALAKHLFIVPDNIRKDPYELAKYYDENQVESSYIPPRMVKFMLKNNKSLKRISVGSERITNLYFNDDPVVMNGYGSTELFGGTLSFKIDKPYENTPIGKPVGEEKAYVLDENNNEVEFGELCIAGFVAKEYLNREEETKKAFVKNPFFEKDGFEHMFRTGDLVQRLPDGNLVFIERKDWMIKINGQRVEPLEVESTIRRFPGIKEAAVKDFTAENGITYLAAYYIGGDEVTEDALRAHCKANLTSYMVPTFYIRMDAFPLNPNGKLDRKNLPKPDISAFKREYVAPESKMEEAVSEAIETVLKCGRIGRNDDFFLLGGDSIKAIEVVNALDDLPLTLETIFAGKTPAGIARLIENGGEAEIPFDRVEKDAYPLTPSQLGVYFAIADDPQTLMYNNPVSIALGDRTDSEKLAAAVEKAVNNHKAYKCRIDVVGGIPCMIPCERTFSVGYEKVADIESALRGFVKPFDFAGGELIRACIFEDGKRKVLALDAHHIVFDGTTLSILLKEIGRSYDGRDLFEEKTSAFDLSTYEEALRDSDKYSSAKKYYETKFDGLDVSNDFMSDHDDKGAATLDTVECALTVGRDKLLKFLKGNNLTENSLLLAAFSYVLAKFNGTNKSLVCVGESGRHTSMTFNTAGMLVKTIALPVDLEGESDIARFVGKMQDTFRDSVKNDAYPFSELATRYGLANDFMFVYHNDAFTSLTLDGEPLPVIGIGNPDAINKMTLMAFLAEDGYRLSFRYRSDLFRRDIIESFAEAYMCAVRGFISKEYLKDVSLVSERQMALLDGFNTDRMPLSGEKTIPESFGEWVRKAPDNELVVYKDHRYTYGAAGKLTDKIAAKIQSLGLARNDVVAILVPRSEWILLAVYGVLKAGCAYEPLDATYPEERLTFMVQNAGAKLLITTREMKNRISGYTGDIILVEDTDGLPDASPLPVKNDIDDLFVLLYTSGTTGTPKGVMLTHGNAIALSALNREKFSIDEHSVNACYASFGFDACTQDLITFPTRGACVIIVPEEMRLDLSEVDRYYIENRVTHAVMTTQVGRQYALLTKSPYLRYMAVGGEALVPFDAEGLTFDFYNLYGPSESSVYVTGTKVFGGEYRVSIGKVNKNVNGYIVDTDMNRLPFGVPGEFIVAGPQVGKGYLNNPEKTAHAFIDNPFTNEKGYEKAYRTGDIVRYLPDGTIEFVGRHDGQVKVRGFRVELTEVEEVIRRADGIRDATVAAFDDPAGGKFIAAYVVSDKTVDVDRLNDFILSEKPYYMVPAVTMQIDEIPLTQNQKVNRRALPKPERKAAVIVPPENETQKKILDIVAGIIGHDEIGIQTDLYEAGLTSISVIRLNVELEKSFGVPVMVADIRENSTVRKLAEFIESSERSVQYELQDDYPITQTQMGVYVECSANPDATTYNIPILLKLGGNIDAPRFTEAVRTALNAHPYVKTTLYADEQGNIRARRNDGAQAAAELIKCEKCPEKEDLVRPFTLIDEPLYRTSVYETSDGNYFFMDFHHIISDGTSENIFLADIGKAYAGLRVETERYTGYEAALEEESIRTTELYDDAKSYYESVFGGCEADCLPPKNVIGAKPGSESVVRLADVDPETVKSYCKKNKFTPNAFFNAAFGYTLSRFGNFEDAVYTTIYNGRSDPRLAGSMSMLVKTLPVLVRANGNRIVADIVRETQKQLLGSMEHDIFSFAEISAAYGIKANIIFAYQGDEFIFDSLAGEPVEMIKVQSTEAKAPITLNVYLKDGRYQFVTDYRTDYYDGAFIDSFLDAFELVLKGFAEKEKTAFITLLSEKAEAFINKTNDTSRTFENVSANRLFEHHAKAHPDRTAVICEDRKLSYGELNSAANRMAHKLIALGIEKNTVVGMLLPRTETLSITELAVLKAGGAFLGLLPDYPDDRIDYCLSDSQSPIVITTKDILESRPTLFGGNKP